jgi:hypothetical protein
MLPLMKGLPLAVSMPCNVMRSTARAVFAMNAHRPGQSPSLGDVQRQHTMLFWGRRACDATNTVTQPDACPASAQ